MSKNQVEQIVVEYSDVVECAFGIIRDLVMDGNRFGNFEIETLQSINSSAAFEQALIHGYTAVLMAGHMPQIEKYHRDNTPFVIVVMRDEKIWAVVKGENAYY